MNRQNDANLKNESKKLLIKYKSRKSARYYSTEEIPLEVIQNCIAIAGSAPSGANMQPWSFIVVHDKEIKRKIRDESEKVEQVFYTKDSTAEWRKDVKQFNTNYSKVFLTEAPYLICIFAKKYDLNEDGSVKKHYFVNESVGIATGFLISAIHQIGLSCLVYSPVPNHFLSDILNRPSNEKPFLILVVGYPKEDFDIERREKKELKDILISV